MFILHLLHSKWLGFRFRIQDVTEHVLLNDIIDFLAEVAYDDSNPAPHTRFATLLSDDAVKEARKAAVPKMTQMDILWCICLWNEWTKKRNSRTGIAKQKSRYH